MRPLLAAIVPATGMFVIVKAVEGATDGLGQQWLRLALLIATGGVVYLALGFALYRQHFRGVIRDVKAIIRPSRNSGSTQSESAADSVSL